MNATNKQSPQGVQYIELSAIDASPTNPRRHFDTVELNDLAASITEHGVLQPILVRPVGDRFEVVAGERRYRASKLADAGTIPALVRELGDDEVLEMQIIENSQRVDVSPADEAIAFGRLLERGYTRAQIARKIGRGARYVSRRVDLLRLPEELRDCVGERLPMASVSKLLALPESAATKWLEEFKEQPRRFGDDSGDDEGAFEWTDDVLAELQEQLEWDLDRQLKSLDFARFALDVDGLAGKCACTTCPMNTARQAELFAGGRVTKDRCLDAECFAAKTLAADVARQVELEASGALIFEGEDVKPAHEIRVHATGEVFSPAELGVPKGWVHSDWSGWTEVHDRAAFVAALEEAGTPEYVVEAGRLGQSYAWQPAGHAARTAPTASERRARFERIVEGLHDKKFAAPAMLAALDLALSVDPDGAKMLARVHEWELDKESPTGSARKLAAGLNDVEAFMAFVLLVLRPTCTGWQAQQCEEQIAALEKALGIEHEEAPRD